jgi:hypothetical protein
MGGCECFPPEEEHTTDERLKAWMGKCEEEPLKDSNAVPAIGGSEEIGFFSRLLSSRKSQVQLRSLAAPGIDRSTLEHLLDAQRSTKSLILESQSKSSKWQIARSVMARIQKGSILQWPSQHSSPASSVQNDPATTMTKYSSFKAVRKYMNSHSIPAIVAFRYAALTSSMHVQAPAFCPQAVL